jgi:prepilin-type N-terminal cleavage/methylation domain-containing protein
MPTTTKMHRTNRRRAQQGFSLIEMLVVVAILTVVMGVVFQQVGMVQKRTRTEDQKIDMLQQSRESLDQLIRELHTMGYPSKKMYASGVLTSPINNNTNLAVGLVKVINGTSALIWFEADVEGDGGVDSVQYRLVATSTESNHCPCIERSAVSKTAADPLTGQGTAFHLAVENVAASGLTFAAFDANGAAVTIPSGGLDINNNTLTIQSIRSMAITVETRGQYPDLQTKQFPAIVLTGLVQFRN